MPDHLLCQPAISLVMAQCWCGWLGEHSHLFFRCSGAVCRHIEFDLCRARIFSIVQPALESRPGLFWGCLGKCLVFFFFFFKMPVAFSDAMLFFVTDSWQVPFYVPYLWAQLVHLVFENAPGTLWCVAKSHLTLITH